MQQVYNSYEVQAKLQTRYINREEINSWDNHLKFFVDIVQDGVYQVYLIYSASKAEDGLNPYIYFDSDYSALNAIKANINKATNIITKTVNVYFYYYVDQNKKPHDIVYTNDQELWKIVRQLTKK